jgi:hypothetical protein
MTATLETDRQFVLLSHSNHCVTTNVLDRKHTVGEVAGLGTEAEYRGTLNDIFDRDCLAAEQALDKLRLSGGFDLLEIDEMLLSFTDQGGF